MSRTLKARPTLEEYINQQIANAKELGNPTCTIFAKDEKALEGKLAEMNLSYITPRVGQYIVSVY
jgi:hypothetical protein